MIIRKYVSTDWRQLADLFYETVHSVNAKDYTSEQLYAWADGSADLEILINPGILICCLFIRIIRGKALHPPFVTDLKKPLQQIR